MLLDAATLEFTCPFVSEGEGRCCRPIRWSGFCARHSGLPCIVCKSQATHECCYAGQLVCGVPLCADCEGWNDPQESCGTWGFMNHYHRRKAGRGPAQPAPRQAVGADFGLHPAQRYAGGPSAY
jgi:hypothetical protein